MSSTVFWFTVGILLGIQAVVVIVLGRAFRVLAEQLSVLYDFVIENELSQIEQIYSDRNRFQDAGWPPKADPEADEQFAMNFDLPLKEVTETSYGWNAYL